MTDELTIKRAERDEAFAEFVAESARASKASAKATAARAKYRLADAEVRELERDYLTYPSLQ